YLRQRHIAERRTKRAHIGHERSLGFGRLRLDQTPQQRCARRQRRGGFQKRASGRARRNPVRRMLHGWSNGRSNEQKSDATSSRSQPYSSTRARSAWSGG